VSGHGLRKKVKKGVRDNFPIGAGYGTQAGRQARAQTRWLNEHLYRKTGERVQVEPRKTGVRVAFLELDSGGQSRFLASHRCQWILPTHLSSRSTTTTACAVFRHRQRAPQHVRGTDGSGEEPLTWADQPRVVRCGWEYRCNM
jgi:hypothetical protein